MMISINIGTLRLINAITKITLNQKLTDKIITININTKFDIIPGNMNAGMHMVAVFINRE